MNMEREPWFYGCLSYVLPGFGQMWMGKFIRGVFFFALLIGTGALLYYFINTQRFVACVPAFISAIALCFLPLITALDTVRQARLRLITSGEIPVERYRDRWWPIFISILLGSFSAGLGYLYLRRWLFFAIWLVLFILITIIPIKPVANILDVILFLGVITHIFILIKRRDGNVAKSAARIFFSLLLFLVCVYYLIEPLFNKFYQCQITMINSSSMEPTLRLNNWIVIDYRSFHKQEPQIGDIAVMDVKKIPKYVEYLRDSDKPIGEIICKRIVAKEGDTVTVVGQLHVYVNGKSVNFGSDAPPEHIQEKDLTPSDQTFIVPSGQYF